MSEEQTGIAAFMPADEAANVERKSDPLITLYHRPNDRSVSFVVKRADVQRFIPGGEQDGHRLMQILLRPGAVVETKVDMLRNVRSLQDPTLKHLTAAAISTH